MLLKSGKVVSPHTPASTAPTFGATSMPMKVQRCSRELTNLDIKLDQGFVYPTLELKDDTSQTTTTQWYDAPLREGRCAGLIKADGKHRQCKKRKSRDSDFCRIHDPRFATQAVQRKQEEVRELRDRMRAARERNQREERRREVDARRFRNVRPDDRLQDADHELIEDLNLQFITVPDDDLQLDELFNLLETHEDQEVNTDIQMKHILNYPKFWTLADRDIVDHAEGRGWDEDPRLRQYDFAVIRGEWNGDELAVVAHRCNICRQFRYPILTELLPEDWSLECGRCGVMAHRHCAGSVAPFGNENNWMCTHCLHNELG